MDVTLGLLQEEVLSSYLFRLFLKDIELFFRSRNFGGIKINSLCDVFLLLYADDLIIVADSYTNVKNKLKILNEYLSVKKLEVNTKKTKLLYFHKGRCKRVGRLFYENTENERYSEYIYLGVPFSDTALFYRTTKYFQSKSRAAIGSVILICAKAKLRTWDSRIKVNDSISISILHYTVQLWALRYIEKLESVSLNFYKRLLSQNKNCPFWLMRLEFKILHCSVAILKLALSWVL